MNEANVAGSCMENSVAGLVTGIYVIRNTRNGKVYVGSSTFSIRHRWNAHKGLLRLGIHYNGHLQAAWNLYGEGSFEFLVVERMSGQDENRVAEQEQHWLGHYRGRGEVYNIVKSIIPSGGHPQTQETKRKISETMKRYRRTEEHNRRLAHSRARDYPALYNEETGEEVPAGHNLKDFTRQRGIINIYPHLSGVLRGERRSCHGWTLKDPKWVGAGIGKPYPAFIHKETGEVIPSGRNLKALCNRYGLSLPSMCNVKNGKQGAHKGWRVREGEQDGADKPRF